MTGQCLWFFTNPTGAPYDNIVCYTHDDSTWYATKNRLYAEFLTMKLSPHQGAEWNKFFWQHVTVVMDNWVNMLNTAQIGDTATKGTPLPACPFTPDDSFFF